MNAASGIDGQDFHNFLARYRSEQPGDVMVFKHEVTAVEDTTAVASALAERGEFPLLFFERVSGLDVPVATNVFGSRGRIARLLDTTPDRLHEAYQAASHKACPPVEVKHGPISEVVSQSGFDLGSLPLMRHFETDRAPYITNGVIVCEDRDNGIGNLSYHRAMVHSETELATSLHSRGHLWRLLQAASERKQALPVAMVIGCHPLFMMAAAARLPYGADERDVAGGLFGAPLACVKTPVHGLMVPAAAEFVLEGVIEPEAHVEEGPFGEFTGYSSDRSTNNLLRVECIMRRKQPILVDVLGGNSSEHLNLGRIPRESEMVEKLKQRFPSVTAVHYPSSGTHFHAYVALKQMRQGEARQVMLGLLGWDPYLKNVVAVDEDVDITKDSEILWALATHFQPARDVVIIDGLPGNALDPSASIVGTTSRMGLDATRGEDFDGVRAKVSDKAAARAAKLLAKYGGK
jgi:4-hydroxy-3-polyprenylbenzoate decarboxylase